MLLVSYYAKEARLKKQIKTWNERAKDVAGDTNGSLKRNKR